MRFNQTPVNRAAHLAPDVNTPFNKYNAVFYSREINSNITTLLILIMIAKHLIDLI